MKTLIFAMLLAFGIQQDLFPQNRICGWETEKISSIEITFITLNSEAVKNTFTSTKDMDAILSFLKKVDFRTIDNPDQLASLQNDEEEYKIVFQGQRDQVYLHKNSACIGKTSFLIDQDVIRGFSALIRVLVKENQDLLSIDTI